MAYLKINRNSIDKSAAAELISICPFSAISYENENLFISQACKMCKLCVNKGTAGAIELVETQQAVIDKNMWNGIAVYVEHTNSKIHPITFELLGKARELASVTNQPVYALFIGSGIYENAEILLKYGADKVYVYQDEGLKNFIVEPYTNMFEDFIKKVKPTVVLVGATNIGRSLAPRMAARFRTGLTADCTSLQMKENTDLVQIRPAFGGNIMAQIITPQKRPQFCTVRYKIFSALKFYENFSGEIINMPVEHKELLCDTEIIEVIERTKEIDISEAEIIVAVGRGLKNRNDLNMLIELSELIGGQIACTRPLVEAGWLDPHKQIGLSGRTVKAKLVLAVGISGSVQFAAGMRNSDCIIAINRDKNAPIFHIAHYGFVGNLYEIIPMLIENIKEANYAI